MSTEQNDEEVKKLISFQVDDEDEKTIFRKRSSSIKPLNIPSPKVEIQSNQPKSPKRTSREATRSPVLRKEVKKNSLSNSLGVVEFSAPTIFIQEQKMIIQKFQSKISKYQKEMNEMSSKMEVISKELEYTLNVAGELKNAIHEDNEKFKTQLNEKIEILETFQKNQQIYEKLLNGYEYIIGEFINKQDNSPNEEFEKLKDLKKDLIKIDLPIQRNDKEKEMMMNKSSRKKTLEKIENELNGIQEKKRNRKPTVVLVNHSSLNSKESVNNIGENNKLDEKFIKENEENEEKTEKSPFEIMLEDNEFYSKYMQFLMSQACEENLLFYSSVVEFRTKYNSIPKTIQMSFATRVFESYIKESSVYELNIDSSMRDAIEERIKNKNIDRNMFRSIFSFTTYMMMTDTFSRFRVKPENKELMERFKNLE
jgi:hypothetical protein